MANVLCIDTAGSIVGPSDPLEIPVSFQSDEARTRMQGDRRIVFDAPNEIPRHRLREAVSSNQHVHVLRTIGYQRLGVLQ